MTAYVALGAWLGSVQCFIQDFISGECKQEPGVTHGYTRELLTYLLT